jgi:hypothetical protein
MTSIFGEALSVVDSSVKGILELAYDPYRFKQYARKALKAKGYNKEAASNEVIWHATSKVTTEGAISGFLSSISLGAYGLASLPGDIVFLMYHLIEMCGALAEIHGLDTNDDYVKTFVLSGAADDDSLRKKAGQAIAVTFQGTAHNAAAKEFTKAVLIPVLKALGVKVSVKGGWKIAEIIPFAGAAMGAGVNFFMVDGAGHSFVDELKRIR